MKKEEILNKFPKIFNLLELHHRNAPPVVHFSSEAVTIFSEISSMRTKNYQSSKRVNPKADETGLLGELSMFRWLGYSGDEALRDFTQGLYGDHGIDCFYENMAIDIKTTASRDNNLKYVFTKSNRNANTANVIVFIRLMELIDGSMNAWLIGWSWKSDINRFLRDSEKYPYIQTLYLEQLKRNKVLYPINHLRLHYKIEANNYE